MNECSCTYCYHDVCFHPIRGEEAGLGVPCDGCQFETPEFPDTGLEDTIQREELTLFHLLHNDTPKAPQEELSLTEEELTLSEEDSPIARILFGKGL